MDLRLIGKRAIVTGSSRGIGRAIAAVLAAEGAGVTVCARSPRNLETAETELRATGAKVQAVAADLGTDEGVAAVWDAHALAFGGVDVFVNNVTGGARPRDVLTATDTDWLDGFTMNVLAHVRFIRRALPGMLERGWGRIVNIASTAGRHPDTELPTYGPNKAALINLSKLLANAYSRYGVLTAPGSRAPMRPSRRPSRAPAAGTRPPRPSSTSTSVPGGLCRPAASASPSTPPTWSRFSAPTSPPGSPAHASTSTAAG